MAFDQSLEDLAQQPQIPWSPSSGNGLDPSLFGLAGQQIAMADPPAPPKPGGGEESLFREGRGLADPVRPQPLVPARPAQPAAPSWIDRALAVQAMPPRMTPAQASVRLQEYQQAFRDGRISLDELNAFRDALFQASGVQIPEAGDPGSGVPAAPHPLTGTVNSRRIFDATIGKIMPADKFRDTYFAGLYHPNIDMLYKNDHGRHQLMLGGDLHNGIETIGSINRILYPYEKSAYHGSLNISDDYQNLGYSKKLLAGQFQFYKQAGYKDVGITAVDKGSYAWARAGFLPGQQEWQTLKDGLMRRLGTMNIPQDEYMHIVNMLKSNDPRTIWKIADLKTPYSQQKYPKLENTTIGKYLLYKQLWSGEFDLNNQDQWRQHYEYIGQKKQD